MMGQVMKHMKLQASSSDKNYQPRYLAENSETKAKRKHLRIVLLSVLAAALLIGGAILAVTLSGSRQPEPALEATTEAPETTAPPETAPPETEPPETEAPTEVSTEAPELPYLPDEALLAAMQTNPAVYGRLTFGDVDPQYIVYPSNNDYYLYHDALGNWDREGAAFIDCRCTLDPRDTNVMIHGHNMDVSNSGRGKAFAPLFKFRDTRYLANHPIFKLETADEVQYYVPYAISTVETNEYLYGYFNILQWNFATEDSFDAYAGHYKRISQIRLPVSVNPDDQLLTLSTCINDGNSTTELRLLTCLRRLREDETAEMMQSLFRYSLGQGHLKPVTDLPEMELK